MDNFSGLNLSLGNTYVTRDGGSVTLDTVVEPDGFLAENGGYEYDPASETGNLIYPPECDHPKDIVSEKDNPMTDALDRAKVLLKAAHEILRKSDEGPYVENALELTASYDGTDCDGYCLGADIEHFFDSDANDPIKNHFS